MDILPAWPSGDDQVQDTLTAIIRKGFFDKWPPDQTVCFYLNALLGYHKEFLQEFLQYSSCFSEQILQLVGSYTFHTYNTEDLCIYVGNCIAVSDFSRVRTSI